MTMRYKGKTLTDEQESHVIKVQDGNDYAVQAPPGSGKTFLLLSMARKLSGYGLSLSFNKLLAVEASKKFHSSVMCKTGHALAFGEVGFKYKDRLKKFTGKQLAENFDIGDFQLFNSPANKAYLILNTIRKYCYSSDRDFKPYHIPRLTILDETNIDLMKFDLLENSRKVFNEMASLSSNMPITHDVYLKLWALSNPIIKKDYIFFDEYQDSNPVIANVIKNQNCQKIFVGDQFQQIYAWRGAINALQDQELNKLYITRSFRFGDAIADMSNQIIRSYYPYGFDYKDFRGNEDVQSSVHYEPIGTVDCVLCRTNRGVINETIKALDRNLSVHILGGTQQIIYLIKSISQLKTKGYSNHPDLFLFTSFTDLKEYANSPMGGDLKPILKLLEAYGKSKLLDILASVTDRSEDADITITTVHKSKGLEWPNVKLANDFKLSTESQVPTNEDTNILYVAASRALNKLDLSECQAAWKQAFDQAKRVNYDKHLYEQYMEEESKQVVDNNIKDLQKDYP